MNKKSIGNPYNCRSKLPADSPMFMGRHKEMRRINDKLAATPPQSVSLVGERRIGKSSLAFRVYSDIKDQADTLAVYLDCNELPKDCRAEDFYVLLNNGLKESFVHRKPDWKYRLGYSSPDFFHSFRELRNFVSSLSSKGTKLVFFLDEFECLPEKQFAGDSFFSNLRALADKPDFSLAFVTVSQTAIKELTHRAIQSSGFYNIFERIPVGLLDDKSIHGLRTIGFNASGYPLTENELAKINYFAGNFAFFNQLACGFLWDAKRDDEAPEWDDLEVKLLPDYESLWKNRSLQEQLLLKGLKEDNERTDLELKELKVRGLVKKEEERFFPFSDFFKRLMEVRFKVSEGE